MAVEAYSQALEAVCAGESAYTPERIDGWRTSLGKIFNRGFWDGYYMGRRLGEWSAKYGSCLSSRSRLGIRRLSVLLSPVGYLSVLILRPSWPACGHWPPC